MEDRSQAILVEMKRLIEESRLLRRKHDQLTEEYEKLKRELDASSPRRLQVGIRVESLPSG
jgi:hypothetical protein